MTTHFNVTWFWFPLEMQTIASSSNKLESVSFQIDLCACVVSVIRASFYMTRNQINDTFLFQNRVKVKVVGEVSEK